MKLYESRIFFIAHIQLLHLLTPEVMLDVVHSCKDPQVVMPGVSLQLIHVFVNIRFIKWLSKKQFSLLTLEHSETDKYKC